ncbi:DegT/DnrJ/EryC1/StrS family aminotransferase [Candidatus Pelagibacter sp. HIMB1542]|uniref:DegT/DnrJ/EryC1/StrS family aminotransferase n=1 Tax=Candidatus Pelagibacter sp. HIMB1542 TaxID=3413346 RepID=UPI003F83BE28
MIKFFTFDKEYKISKKKILYEIDKVLKSGQVFFGQEILKLEINLNRYLNSKYGLTVKSGTDAIYLALKACGIKDGDEVITSSLTAIPTISAIINAGAKPRLVDINLDNGLIDENKIENFINKNTKAIIPVHLYGSSSEITKICKIAKKHNLKVIEDCAQSFGSKYKNKFTGTYGDFGCFSFYPTKVLGTYGDGGFIVTKKKTDLKKLKLMRFYGIDSKSKNGYQSILDGTNSRMDHIQAAILNFKLKSINKDIKKRQLIAEYYYKNLVNISFLKYNKFNTSHSFHLFVVKHKKRNLIQKLLKEKKVETLIHYQNPIHKMKNYRKLVCNFCNCLKNSENFSKEIFSLPLYPSLKLRDQKKIVKSLNEIMEKLN